MTTMSNSSAPIRLDLDEPSDKEKEFRKFINENLFGQPEAVEMLVSAFNASNSMVRRSDRPVFVAMSLGPSRTGKSEGPRLLAQFLHGNPDCLVRHKLNLIKEKHQIIDFVGAPSSYVGSDKPAELSRAKLEQSRAKSKNKDAPIILVLEEVEKAHKNIFDVIMAIVADGETKIGPDLVSFKDVIVIMTSNLAATDIAKLTKPSSLGFQTGDKPVVTQQRVDDLIRDQLAKTYRPEFINRIDEICVHRALDHDGVRKIVQREVRRLAQMILEQAGDKQFFFVVGDPVIDFLLEKATRQAEEMDRTTSGAGSPVAELHRLIQVELTAPVNRMLERGLVGIQDVISAELSEDGQRIEFFKSEASERAKQKALSAFNLAKQAKMRAAARKKQEDDNTVERAGTPQPGAEAEKRIRPETGSQSVDVSQPQAKLKIAELVVRDNANSLFRTRQEYEKALNAYKNLEILISEANRQWGTVVIKFQAPMSVIAVIKRQYPKADINTFPSSL